MPFERALRLVSGMLAQGPEGALSAVSATAMSDSGPYRKRSGPSPLLSLSTLRTMGRSASLSPGTSSTP